MTTKEQRKTFIDLYNQGYSIKEISDTCNVKWNAIYRILNNAFTEIRDELEICKKYKSNISTVSIAKEYNVDHHLIARILEKHGIKRTGESTRIYKINKEYFDSIDTPNKAYILGFFYADGCNFPPKGTVSMSLQETDKEILEKIRLEIESEKPLEYLDYSSKNTNGYHYQNQYRLLLFSSHMSTSLSSLGMTQNKSLSLTFPNFLNEELISHFIRGYFDGDGCVHFAQNGNCIINMTSTESFCKTIQDYVFEKLNIHASISDASCHNGVTKVLQISGKNQVKTFLDFIYDDAELYLERKYNLYSNKYYNFSQAA